MNATFDRIVLLSLLLLAGCAPEGYSSFEEWRGACIAKGGIPMSNARSYPAYACFKQEAVIDMRKTR